MRDWAVKRGKCPDVLGNFRWSIYNSKGSWERSFPTWRGAMHYIYREVQK